MGTDVLSRVERGRAAHDRMAGDDIRPQAALPAVHLAVYRHFPALRGRSKSVDAGPVPRDSRRGWRWASTDGAGHSGGHLPARKARVGVRALWHHHYHGAHDRPDAGWMADRQLLVAVDLLHQSSRRSADALSGVPDGGGPALSQRSQ